MKILVDTNIIIDALTSREPFREDAEQIFLLAANQIEDMYITASSATDIYYLLWNTTFRVAQKAQTAPVKLKKADFKLNWQVYAATTGASQPSAFNFLRYALILRSLLNWL